FTDKISFLVNNHLLAKRSYHKISISILNNDFTLIPEAYVEEANLSSLLKFATGSNQRGRAMRHNLRNISFCFEAEHDLVNYLERTFTNASIGHCGALSITLMLSQQ